jgi:hypothetical protein
MLVVPDRAGKARRGGLQRRGVAELSGAGGMALPAAKTVLGVTLRAALTSAFPATPTHSDPSGSTTAALTPGTPASVYAAPNAGCSPRLTVNALPDRVADPVSPGVLLADWLVDPPPQPLASTPATPSRKQTRLAAHRVFSNSPRDRSRRACCSHRLR